MSRSVLADAFGHHVWATLHLIDACSGLRAEELTAAVPGAYGPILDTLRHLVRADAGYLSVLTGGRVPVIDDAGMDLAALRSAMEADGAAWASLLEGDLDPDRVIVRRHEDGSETRAPLGIRLAQALHHGSDHRSQVCTALTLLGIEPPEIDAWAFAWDDGRLVEVPAPS